MDKSVTEKIARVRHAHFDEKRKGKIQLVEQTIRDGMLQSFHDTAQAANPLVPAYNFLERGGKSYSIHKPSADIPLR